MIRKAPSFFTSRCSEILALQEDLQADFLGAQLDPYPAQLCPSSPPCGRRFGLSIIGVKPIYPPDIHSFIFYNPNKNVYEAPKCFFQGSLFR